MKSSHDDGSRQRIARWLRLSLRAKGVATLAVPMAALFAALFSIFYVESAVRDTERVVAQTYEARTEILQLEVVLLDASSAVNGYLVTKEPQRLVAYERARTSSLESLERLASLVGDDAASMAALAEIKRATGEVIRALTQVIASPGTGGPLVERSAAMTRELQDRLTIMGKAQVLRLFRAAYNRDIAREKLFQVVIACGILGPLGALFLHLLLTGRLIRRLRQVGENARRLAHGLPVEPAAGGTDEVADLARQIEEAAHLLQERERELRDNERRYRELFDQAPIAYLEIDRPGTVRRANGAACNLLQKSSAQVLGCQAWEHLDPDRQEDFRSAFLERIRGGTESAPFELDCVVEDGSRIRVEMRENYIRNENGDVTGVCASLLDITERHLSAIAARKVEQYALELRNRNEQLGRALEAAQEAAIAKSRFLAGVSHELRTPLNGIIGFTELLHDGKLGEVSLEQRDALSDILNSAGHLLHLINDILDLSKVEAGKMEFRAESANIEALVTEVRDVIRPLAEEKDIRLSVDVPPALSAVTDPGRFKQILYNYLSNAVKFTPAGGLVAVRVSVEDNAMLRVEVEDTGIGIAPEEIPKLFQEFQQLPSGRRAEQGTGLGLALTRRIVEAQGGTVEVRSVVGNGSVFSAVLPLHPRIAGKSAAAF